MRGIIGWFSLQVGESRTPDGRGGGIEKGMDWMTGKEEREGGEKPRRPPHSQKRKEKKRESDRVKSNKENGGKERKEGRKENPIIYLSSSKRSLFLLGFSKKRENGSEITFGPLTGSSLPFQGFLSHKKGNRKGEG